VIGHLKQFAHKVSNNLEQADWTTRREIMRALVKRIEMDKEAVRIVYRVAPPPFAKAPKKGLLQYCLRREESFIVHHLTGVRQVWL